MITNNFRQAIKIMLVNHINKSKGGLPVVNTSGNTKYLCCISGWPSGSAVATSLFVDNNDNRTGIRVGSGTTPPTVNDYNLESRITSGLSGSVTIYQDSELDANGNPQLKILVTLTNNSGSDITVSELGFFQSFEMANDLNGSNKTSKPLLLDRTLLNTPVTIPSGESTVITYILKTVIN